MGFFVYPTNDFLIAMGFTAIYFYEGKNKKEQRSNSSQDDVRPDINN
jgi:hypothetical protein